MTTSNDAPRVALYEHQSKSAQAEEGSVTLKDKTAT
jgi:hypothetical protein